MAPDALAQVAAKESEKALLPTRGTGAIETMQERAQSIAGTPIAPLISDQWGALVGVSDTTANRPQGHVIPLHEIEHVLGRALPQGTPHHFDQLAVSAQHCRITHLPSTDSATPGKAFLQDTSSNGTYVDGVRLQRNGDAALLHHGCLLSLVGPPSSESALVFVYVNVPLAEAGSAPPLGAHAAARPGIKRKVEDGEAGGERERDGKRVHGSVPPVTAVGAAATGRSRSGGGPVSLTEFRSMQKANEDAEELQELRRQLEAHAATIETLTAQQRNAESVQHALLCTPHSLTVVTLESCKLPVASSLLGVGFASTLADAELDERMGEQEVKRACAEVEAAMRAQLQEAEAHSAELAARLEERGSQVAALQREAADTSQRLSAAAESGREAEAVILKLRSEVGEEKQARVRDREAAEAAAAQQEARHLETAQRMQQQSHEQIHLLQRSLSTERQRLQGARERIMLRETQLRAFHSTAAEIAALQQKQQEQLYCMIRTLEDGDEDGEGDGEAGGEGDALHHHEEDAGREDTGGAAPQPSSSSGGTHLNGAPPGSPMHTPTRTATASTGQGKERQQATDGGVDAGVDAEAEANAAMEDTERSSSIGTMAPPQPQRPSPSPSPSPSVGGEAPTTAVANVAAAAPATAAADDEDVHAEDTPMQHAEEEEVEVEVEDDGADGDEAHGVTQVADAEAKAQESTQLDGDGDRDASAAAAAAEDAAALGLMATQLVSVETPDGAAMELEPSHGGQLAASAAAAAQVAGRGGGTEQGACPSAEEADEDAEAVAAAAAAGGPAAAVATAAQSCGQGIVAGDHTLAAATPGKQGAANQHHRHHHHHHHQQQQSPGPRANGRPSPPEAAQDTRQGEREGRNAGAAASVRRTLMMSETQASQDWVAGDAAATAAAAAELSGRGGKRTGAFRPLAHLEVQPRLGSRHITLVGIKSPPPPPPPPREGNVVPRGSTGAEAVALAPASSAHLVASELAGSWAEDTPAPSCHADVDDSSPSSSRSPSPSPSPPMPSSARQHDQAAALPPTGVQQSMDGTDEYALGTSQVGASDSPCNGGDSQEVRGEGRNGCGAAAGAHDDASPAQQSQNVIRAASTSVMGRPSHGAHDEEGSAGGELELRGSPALVPSEPVSQTPSVSLFFKPS
eukprot:jgi/Mesen1/1120/ME000123S00291